MVRDALLEGARPTVLRTVAGAAELEEYLAREDPVGAPPPSIVLVALELDDAEAAIRAVKDDPERRRVPVVALTRRNDPAQVARAYDAGANTVLPRPVTFLALVRLIKVFTAYWLETAELPAGQAT
jgi:two-component system response regulator